MLTQNARAGGINGVGKANPRVRAAENKMLIHGFKFRELFGLMA